MPIISPTRDIPDIEDWVIEIGRTGQLMHQLGAAEGAAGNISLYLPDQTPGVRGFCLGRFPRDEPFQLPDDVQLPAGVLLVTGSGRRLRDVLDHPDRTLCVIVIDSSGAAWLHRPNNMTQLPTSEIDSHIGIHAAALGATPKLHAVVHAQPSKTTYLSHLPAYQESARFTRQLFRWQPETVAALPNGVTVLPYVTPGTAEQGVQTAVAMRRGEVVLWAGHGVIARSFDGPMAAADLIEYLEAAAGYELLDIQLGRPATGLTLAQLRAICERFERPSRLPDSLPEDLLPANGTPLAGP
jgi:rhamnulose-1-phosphate aldolase